jgi:hypothetical protein
MHPCQRELPPEIEELWLAALEDAQTESNEALLYTLDGESGNVWPMAGTASAPRSDREWRADSLVTYVTYSVDFRIALREDRPVRPQRLAPESIRVFAPARRTDYVV